MAKTRLIGLVLLVLGASLGCNLLVQTATQVAPTASLTETPTPISTPVLTPTLQPTQTPTSGKANPRLVAMGNLVEGALLTPEIRDDCTFGSESTSESPGFLPDEPEAIIVRSLAWHAEEGLCGMATAYIFEQNADAYSYFWNAVDGTLFLRAEYVNDWENSQNAYIYSLDDPLNCVGDCMAQGVFANGNMVLYVMTRDVDAQRAGSLMYNYLVEFYTYIEEESGGEYTSS